LRVSHQYSFCRRPSYPNPVTVRSSSARLTHRVHQALRDTGRKTRADVARPIQLETALSYILSTPHLPIGMDASPHVLGEIRAVPVLVLRNNITAPRTARG
jgi:hypothetical protein